MTKGVKERYKNDPEWLEKRRQEENAANRHAYRKKKEKQKDGDTCLHSDSDTSRR